MLTDMNWLQVASCLALGLAVSWTAIHGQFGAGFRLARQVKPTFVEALTVALAVYPEARVDLEKEGIIMHPSAPAVPRTEARRLGIG